MINFFGRADANRAGKEDESTLSSTLETKVVLRNTSKGATVSQVLSPAIKEEKFLSWLQAEPPILQWLPTCHRLSATETVTRPARCGICRDFPITGLRYGLSSVLLRQSRSKWVELELCLSRSGILLTHPELS